MTDMEIYLRPTEIIDSDHPSIRQYAEELAAGKTEPSEIAVALFYGVRDPIRYDPYRPFYRPEHYRASTTLAVRRGFCIPKAALLCALARNRNIPARLGFATVKNHLATPKMKELMGSDIFVYHGYTELYLDGRWVKVTPAFDIGLCEKFGVPPVEFDGRNDAIFQMYDQKGNKFIEYLEEHGTYHDVPVDQIVQAWEQHYGKDRIDKWREYYEKLRKEDNYFTDQE